MDHLKTTESKIQLRADALDGALCHASHNILGKKVKQQITKLGDGKQSILTKTVKQAGFKYKRTRLEAHKTEWLLLQA